MNFLKPLLALCLAATMSAQQIPAAPARVEKINWQAPPDPSAAPKPQKPKKSGGKGKWIAIAAVAGGAAVAVVLVNKRLGNEGKGIF